MNITTKVNYKGMSQDERNEAWNTLNAQRALLKAFKHVGIPADGWDDFMHLQNLVDKRLAELEKVNNQ